MSAPTRAKMPSTFFTGISRPGFPVLSESIGRARPNRNAAVSHTRNGRMRAVRYACAAMRPALRERVHLSRESLLKLLPETVQAGLLDAMQGRSFRASIAWHGGAADTYLLHDDGGAATILKVFREAGRAGFEAEALDRVAAAAIPELRMPNLIAALGDGRAILMEYVEAASIRETLRDGNATPAAAAVALALAVRAYHRLFSAPFRDLHPANVLSDRDGGLVLLDPAPPGSRTLDPGQFLPIDVAFWTYATVVNLPWDLRASLRAGWRMLEMNSRFVVSALAPEPQAASRAREAERITRRHLRRMLHRWPRDKALYPVAWAAAWLVFRRANWLLRHGQG